MIASQHGPTPQNAKTGVRDSFEVETTGIEPATPGLQSITSNLAEKQKGRWATASYGEPGNAFRLSFVMLALVSLGLVILGLARRSPQA